LGIHHVDILSDEYDAWNIVPSGQAVSHNPETLFNCPTGHDSGAFTLALGGANGDGAAPNPDGAAPGANGDGAAPGSNGNGAAPGLVDAPLGAAPGPDGAAPGPEGAAPGPEGAALDPVPEGGNTGPEGALNPEGGIFCILYNIYKEKYYIFLFLIKYKNKYIY